MPTGIELLVECRELLEKAPICCCDHQQCWSCMLREEVEAYLDKAKPGWREAPSAEAAESAC